MDFRIAACWSGSVRKRTKEGCACYERAHQELLALPQGLIEQLGEEKMRQLAGLMHEVAEKFPDISEEVAGKE